LVNREDLFKPISEIEKNKLNQDLNYNPEVYEKAANFDDDKSTKSKKKKGKKKKGSKKKKQDESDDDEDDPDDEPV